MGRLWAGLCLQQLIELFDLNMQKQVRTFYNYTLWKVCAIINLEVSEMTEREKMLSGELYDPTDKELEQFLILHVYMYVKYI